MSCPVTGQTGTCPATGSSRGKGISGCPVMNQGFPDPPLQIFQCYPTYTNVTNDFILTFRGIPAMNNQEFIQKRKKFDKYPLFLKHTLFHGDEMVKVRKLSVMHKYVIFDDLKQKGNEKFNEGWYEQAQEYYEQALGCYSFLHCEEYLKDKRITFTDENVQYIEPKGEDSLEEDQKKQFLLIGYQNLIAVGIRLGQFKYAKDALNKAFEISKKHPKLSAWRAVIIVSNMTSSIEDLQKALKNINVAIEVEKLAIKNNPKKSNESLQLFEQLLENIKNTMTEIEKQKNDYIKQILQQSNNRTKMHDFILEDEDLTELKLIIRIDDFYRKMLSYYEENTKPEYPKIRQCRFELQDIKRIKHNMNLILNISNESLQYQADLQNIQINTIKDHIKIVKQQIAKNIFMEGKYHPEILQHAMDSITKEKQKDQDNDFKTPEESEWSGLWWYILFFVIFIVAVFGMRYYYKKGK